MSGDYSGGMNGANDGDSEMIIPDFYPSRGTRGRGRGGPDMGDTPGNDSDM